MKTFELFIPNIFVLKENHQRLLTETTEETEAPSNSTVRL